MDCRAPAAVAQIKQARRRLGPLSSFLYGARMAKPHTDDSIIASLWICVADPLGANLLPRQPLGQSVSTVQEWRETAA